MESVVPKPPNLPTPEPVILDPSVVISATEPAFAPVVPVWILAVLTEM